MKQITLEELDTEIQEQARVLLYVSSHGCSVCHSLRPKVEDLSEVYPETSFRELSADTYPELAARLEILTVPVVLFFYHGREKWRGARFIRMDELEHVLDQWKE
ncbi:thioredoxin family protein [Alkalicoccus urumqiensis]|uniref:Thioredoxin n=1 Tax=Alkalicoccus urumqiensis TaxID=1548213 RepID=A0A2P6MJ40_ALKUR|nr:thioredoxin family protein [Alkalicoccus urumqiensis]PRO66286.1 thioredoxin [Alkalicoccus urumqiensis]